MQDQNMFIDDDASKSKMPRRKLLSQTTSGAQFQAHNEVGQEEALKMSKTSKKSQKSGNSKKKGDSSRSPSNGLPEYSPLTKSANEYRALRHKYLILEEEGSSLGDELKQVESEVKNLEEEKLALLDELVVLEGLVERPGSESPAENV
uniref:Uncharacterized protein n=1 Tax=Picea sitchensis TaxID=3332 RepID=D5AAZ8_PICSI|nr:unknown [Picea sitchensis]